MKSLQEMYNPQAYEFVFFQVHQHLSHLGTSGPLVKLSDDIRANAEAQAKQIVREAEGRSDLLLQKTQARLEDVQREIDGMKLKRREVENSLESSISTLRSTLEFVREQEQRERDEKILLHRPRQADQQPQTPARADEPRTAGQTK